MMNKKRELYYIDSEKIDQEQLKLTTINQTWFKFLALVSLACALFVCASLVWLIVCRPNRLPQTDQQIKRDAIEREQVRKRKRHCQRHEQDDFRRRLRYLLFGKLKVRSPSFSSQSTQPEPGVTKKDVSVRNVNEKKKQKDSKKN